MAVSRNQELDFSDEKAFDRFARNYFDRKTRRLMKNGGLGIFDLIFIDGKSVKETFSEKYAKLPPEERDRMMKAEVVSAFQKGKSRITVTKPLEKPDRSIGYENEDQEGIRDNKTLKDALPGMEKGQIRDYVRTTLSGKKPNADLTTGCLLKKKLRFSDILNGEKLEKEKKEAEERVGKAVNQDGNILDKTAYAKLLAEASQGYNGLDLKNGLSDFPLKDAMEDGNKFAYYVTNLKVAKDWSYNVGSRIRKMEKDTEMMGQFVNSVTPEDLSGIKKRKNIERTLNGGKRFGGKNYGGRAFNLLQFFRKDGNPSQDLWSKAGEAGAKLRTLDTVVADTAVLRDFLHDCLDSPNSTMGKLTSKPAEYYDIAERVSGIEDTMSKEEKLAYLRGSALQPDRQKMNALVMNPAGKDAVLSEIKRRKISWAGLKEQEYAGEMKKSNTLQKDRTMVKTRRNPEKEYKKPEYSMGR